MIRAILDGFAKACMAAGDAFGRARDRLDKGAFTKWSDIYKAIAEHEDRIKDLERRADMHLVHVVRPRSESAEWALEWDYDDGRAEYTVPEINARELGLVPVATKVKRVENT